MAGKGYLDEQIVPSIRHCGEIGMPRRASRRVGSSFWISGFVVAIKLSGRRTDNLSKIAAQHSRISHFRPTTMMML